LFSSLQLLLPCGDCCSHYCSSFQRKDLMEHLESKETFSKWLVGFHNQVNKRLKKSEYSYDQAKSFYLNEDATCAIQSPCGEDHIQQTSQSITKVSLRPWAIGACVALLLFFVYMSRKK
jgi:hypothetical protein